MKPIVAENQVKLGMGRCLRLALTGMSFRLVRSGITVAILMLAVAFLVHMLAYGLMSNQIRQNAWAELSADLALGQTVNRLGTPDTVAVVQAALVEADADRLEEYRAWSGLSEQEMAAVVESAGWVVGYEAFLEDLPGTARAAVLGDRTPTEVFDRLTNSASVDAFVASLEAVSVRLPKGEFGDPGFKAVMLEHRPGLVEAEEAIRQGHRDAIAGVQQAYPGVAPMQVFLQDGEAAVADTLSGLGYAVRAEDLQALAGFAQRQTTLSRIGEALQSMSARQPIARRYKLEVGEVETGVLMERIKSAKEAEAVAAILSDSGLLVEDGSVWVLEAGVLWDLAQRARRGGKLDRAVGGVQPEVVEGWFGLPVRTRVLIALAFLVCVVGVANAMLMSVTERFTEIATMKCLGAMDRFVMMMFVFEAAIQGVVGGLMGLVLGVVLSVLRVGVEFGSLSGWMMQAAGQVTMASLLSLVVGLLLAVFAAVGPSWVAARLAPMEAMRVE